MNVTKENVILSISSVLTILFALFHLADDIVYKLAPGGFFNLPAIVVSAVWLYAAVLAAEKRWGRVLLLIMSLLATGLPIIHMSGKSGITAAIPKAGAAFFFAWNLLAVGVTAVFSAILAARLLFAGRVSE